MFYVEFLSQKELLARENDIEVRVSRVMVVMTGKEGYMASLYHFERFCQDSDVFKTKEEAEKEGKEMFIKKKKEMEEFLKSLK